MSKQQMDKMAQNILARRENSSFRPEDNGPAVPSAVAQHQEETAKILARRGIKAEAKEIADAPADDFGDEAVDPGDDAEVPGAHDDTHVSGSDVVDQDEQSEEVIPAPIQWHEMEKKDLRIECDKLGIEYKKKDTNEKLIAKLTGV